MTASKYIHDETFHRAKDAEEIIPFIIKLFHPKSVIDIGCGLGTFLQAFKKLGIDDIVGIEGAWLDRSKTVIPAENIIIADLENEIHLNRKFDLAICLEVGEHLSLNAAEALIRSLTAHSDIILFSAAIPHQGGQNHINEQWIDFWQSKFKKCNFELFDLLRSTFWNNKNIFWWYRQNMLVAINNSYSVNFPKKEILNLIHPELYLSKIEEINYLKDCLNKIMAGEIQMELAEEIMNNAKKNNGVVN